LSLHHCASKKKADDNKQENQRQTAEGMTDGDSFASPPVNCGILGIALFYNLLDLPEFAHYRKQS
jgi:hypothetical protein